MTLDQIIARADEKAAADVCGAKSKSAEMIPVESELLAAGHGWLTQANPFNHTCPTCAPVPAATPTAGR